MEKKNNVMELGERINDIKSHLISKEISYEDDITIEINNNCLAKAKAEVSEKDHKIIICFYFNGFSITINIPFLPLSEMDIEELFLFIREYQLQYFNYYNEQYLSN